MSTQGEPDNDPGSGAPERKRRFAWLSISLSAFIMSFTTAMINVYYALRSSEVVVQPPRHVLLYRDGEGEQAVLSAAVRLELINTAKDYGDVLLETRLVPFPGEPAFVQEGVAQPAFTPDSAKAVSDCALGSSCVGLDGLVVIQRSDVIMDMPGGSAKALTPYFWIVPYGCEGDQAKCAAYGNFDQAVSRLAAKPINLQIKLRFQNDGERDIICRGGKLDAEYLRDVGWTQLACEEAAVTKPGLF
jgi:hypothetical protein